MHPLDIELVHWVHFLSNLCQVCTNIGNLFKVILSIFNIFPIFILCKSYKEIQLYSNNGKNFVLISNKPTIIITKFL